MKSTERSLQHLLKDNYDKWMQYDMELYYRKGVFHGVIATLMKDDLLFIFSAAYEHDFTLSMLRDIIRLSKRYNICLVADSQEHQGSVARSLDRWDCEYYKLDGVMFAYHTKE